MKRNDSKPFVLFNLNDPLFNRIIGGSLCAEGRYKGVTEPTYRRFLEDDDQVKHYAKCLEHDEQESILYVDGSRNAYLVDCATQKQTYMGMFKQVEYQRLDDSVDYTHFFGKPDSYYYVSYI
jgi:lipocalin